MADNSMGMCPYCSNHYTAKLYVSSSQADKKRMALKTAKTGMQYYAVSPDDYKKEYLPFRINAYCPSCTHFFTGRSEKDTNIISVAQAAEKKNLKERICSSLYKIFHL